MACHEQFHLRPKPGTLIIFPGYLEHENAVIKLLILYFTNQKLVQDVQN